MYLIILNHGLFQLTSKLFQLNKSEEHRAIIYLAITNQHQMMNIWSIVREKSRDLIQAETSLSNINEMQNNDPKR